MEGGYTRKADPRRLRVKLTLKRVEPLKNIYTYIKTSLHVLYRPRVIPVQGLYTNLSLKFEKFLSGNNFKFKDAFPAVVMHFIMHIRLL